MSKPDVRVFKKEVIQYYQAAPYHEIILQHISQGIIFINSKGIITSFNQSAENLLNMTTANVLFQPYSSQFQDTSFGFSINKAMTSKECPKMCFIVWAHTDGTQYEIEVESIYVDNHTISQPSHLLDSDCQEGILILLRNVTEINRLQRVASQHNRLQDIGEMAARVAHEIRNPLGSIIGFASLLQHDLRDHPELQKIAHYILEGTENLNRTVSNILAYSRSIEPQLTKSDLIPLIQELLDQSKNDPLYNASIEYRFHTNENPLFLLMDSALMKSALFNLVINALEAMPNGGIMKILCEKKMREVWIQVIDTGTGIPAENKDKIFLPFFTTKKDGNGLGLSEVQKAIQAQHGVIEVESELNHGACFTIKMPLL